MRKKGGTWIWLSRAKHFQADCKRKNARLNVELRGARFRDILHVWRQLLLYGTPGAAIPLHYLHAAASVAAVEESVLYYQYVFITRSLIASAPTETSEVDHVGEGTAYSSAVSI